MGAPACTDEEFIELWKTHGSLEKVAEAVGTTRRNTQYRRRRIEQRYNMTLAATENPAKAHYYKHLSPPEHSARKHLECNDGTVLIFSDAHF